MANEKTDYAHLPYFPYHAGGNTKVISEIVLDFSDKRLLVLRKADSFGEYSVIQGFIERYKYGKIEFKDRKSGSIYVDISELLEVPEELKGIVARFVGEQGLEGFVAYADFWRILHPPMPVDDEDDDLISNAPSSAA